MNKTIFECVYLTLSDMGAYRYIKPNIDFMIVIYDEKSKTVDFQ